MKYNLICFGYNAWSEYWKRNQIMVHGLAQQEFVGRVLFINPAIWLEQSIRNPSGERDGIRKYYWQAITPRKIGPEITVWTPLYLPRVAHWTARELTRKIAGYTGEPYILLINCPLDLDDTTRTLVANAELAVFDWSDDFSQFASGESDKRAVQDSIDRIISSADVVLAVNEALRERAARLCHQSHCIRNATNLAMFPASCGGGQRSRVRRVVGYTGWLVPDRLDTALIHHCARSIPECDFVFVGPKVSADPLDLKRAPRNVIYRAPVKYCDLANTINSFDVCIIPNRVNQYTSGNDPIKIYDYLYMGKPVVTTPTAGVEEFADLVAIRDQPEGFLQAIRLALSDDTLEMVERRREIGRQHSWPHKMERVVSLVRGALGGKRSRASGHGRSEC